jgi:hypothetical protein
VNILHNIWRRFRSAARSPFNPVKDHVGDPPPRYLERLDGFCALLSECMSDPESRWGPRLTYAVATAEATVDPPGIRAVALLERKIDLVFFELFDFTGPQSASKIVSAKSASVRRTRRCRGRDALHFLG